MRILIADDHAIVRRGLKQIILEEFPSAVIGEVSDSSELVKKAILESWDVVLSDLHMPGRGGLDALKQIKQAFPNLPVLIMSMYPEDQYAVRVLKAGASGYLSKTSIHDELINAIRAVSLGKKFITPALAEHIVDAFHKNNEEFPHKMLSDREFEVFKLLASGKAVSEIAQELSLSSTTVSTYRSRILEKMKMRSNTDLVRYAVENNLI